MKFSSFSLALTAGLFSTALFLMPEAKADQWDKQSIVTFRQPVEIPGMVLGPGTYTMRLLDSSSDRHIVEFLNKDGNHLYKMVLAIPDYRVEPSDHTIITFEERAAGAPQAIKSWFYPGDNFGQEFVYPRAEQPHPATVAQVTNAAPPPPAPAAQPAPPAPVAQANPAPAPSKPVEVAQANPAPAPAPTETQLPKELPKTASSLPLIGLLGTLMASVGAYLRRSLA